MGLFRFLQRWPAIIPPESSLAPVVPFLDDRDRELEDYLADVAGEARNEVITYATGGVTIAYSGSYTTAPVPVCNIERPVGTDPNVIYVSNATTAGFDVSIYDGAGAEVGAGGNYRVFWHARPAGA